MTLLINPQTFTVTRKTGADVFNQSTFEFEAGTETTFTITGELQPLKDIERDDLPEGYRKRGTLKLYTAARLRVISQEAGKYSDIIHLTDLEGESIAHEVFGEQDRSAGAWPVAHYRYVLLRVGADEG